MRQILIPIVIGVGLLAGCATGGRMSGLEQLNREEEATFYWGRTTYLTFNQVVAVAPDIWCQEANDHSLKHEKRCLAVALLFGAWVQPGFTTEKMRTAIPGPRWLTECKLEPFGYAVGGGRPLLLEGSHFRLLLFPDEKGDTDWWLCFTLSSSQKVPPRPVDEATAFLIGTHGDKSLQITEFVMYYPLPGRGAGSYVEERHSSKGVGIKVRPISWFGDEW